MLLTFVLPLAVSLSQHLLYCSLIVFSCFFFSSSLLPGTLSKEIEIKILKIERLQQSQQHWRSKIASNQRECSARNKALQTERDAIAGHYKALKDRMNNFRYVFD